MTIDKTAFSSNLIEFELGVDVILDMEWLAMFKAEIDCEKQKVNIRSSLGKVMSYHRYGKPRSIGIISGEVSVINQEGKPNVLV